MMCPVRFLPFARPVWVWAALLVSSACLDAVAQVRDTVPVPAADTARRPPADSLRRQRAAPVTALPDTVRPAPPPVVPPLWAYTAGVDGMLNSGNVTRRLLTLRLAVHHDNPKSVWGFFASPRFQYGTNNEVLQERELFLDFNNTWFHGQHDVYGLFFGTYEQSNLRRIDHRLNAGLGAGWKVLGGRRRPGTWLHLSLSNALLREYSDFATGARRRVYRNSTRLKLRADLVKDKLTLQNTTFFQPAIGQRNLRWNSVSQLVLKVGRHLALAATLDQSYESLNVQGVESTQANAMVGFTYTGGR